MQEKNKIKISICVPTYNSELFIRETIDSILMQDYDDYEIIIVDDCSCDNTCNIIREYQVNERKIRFFTNKNNLGIVGNFNKCIELSRGEYIKFLLADDYFLKKESLKSFVNIAESYPYVSLISSARKIVDQNSKIIKMATKYKEGEFRLGINIIKDCLFSFKNKIGEPTSVMFRKNQSLRGFDSNYKQILDLEMWFHLLEKGSFYYIEEPLVAFRVHDNQMSQKNKLNLVYVDDNLKIIKDYSCKAYINCSFFIKYILILKHCEYLHRIYGKRLISREIFRTKVNEALSVFLFAALRPVYKICKNILRIKIFRS